MDTTPVDLWTPGGRRVSVWRSVGEGGGDGPAVIVAPGFGRTMADLVTVASYLTANGAVVYRLDPLDHVGLSDGTIRDYTPSATAESLATVLDAVSRAETRPVVVVAASMAARPAVRVCLGAEVSRLVTVVGVVHMRRTIGAVFGEDIVALSRAELPLTVRFEDLEIGTHAFFDDKDNGWWDIDVTAQEAAALDVPVTAIFASGDPWVDAGDVRAVYRGHAAPRELIEIPSDVHDLGLDPAAGLSALEAIARSACGGGPRTRVPTLEQLGADIVAEQLLLSPIGGTLDAEVAA